MEKIKNYIFDLTARISGEEGNAMRYRFIYALCFITHAFYAILFYCVGVNELMYFNIGSTVMYLTGLIAVGNNHLTLLWITLLSVEITAHTLLCSIFVGIGYQFSLFSLAIIPVVYFMMYLDPAIKHALVLGSFFALLNVVAMIGVLDISACTEPKYVFPIKFAASIARFNLILAVLILIFFSVIFIGKINFDLNILKDRNEILDRLANYDQLTGLRNRNHIHEIFDLYVRSTDPYCVILGDIDDFKHVNDTFGHSAGDEVLKTVSAIISDTVGDKGVVCRWGGEEILILIKGSTDECIAVNEDILRKIRGTEVRSGNYRIKVTMTFGLCDYSSSMNIEKLISLADKRLYIGKTNGKNRIVTQS